MNVSVNFTGMTGNCEDMANAIGKLGNQVTAVRRTKGRGIYIGKTSSQVSRKIGNILGDLENEQAVFTALKAKLSDITTTYRNCEQELANTDQLTGENSATNDSNTQNQSNGSTENGTSETEDENTYLNSTLIKLLGEVGIVGSGLASILTWGSSDDWIKNALSSAKFVTKAIGKSANAVSSGGTFADWEKALWGTTDALLKANKNSAGAAFTSSMANQLKELFPESIATPADGVKVGTKWLVNLLTVATNGYENYQEMQEDGISVERAVAETVVESAVDISLGMAATAAVSAAAVAFGATAAPAFAIGIASAGVVWAANGVCKWATKTFGGEEKDLGEVAADFVCDFGEEAVQVVKSGVEAVSNAVEDAAEKVKEGVNTVKNKLSTAWNSLFESRCVYAGGGGGSW